MAHPRTSWHGISKKPPGQAARLLGASNSVDGFEVKLEGDNLLPGAESGLALLRSHFDLVEPIYLRTTQC